MPDPLFVVLWDKIAALPITTQEKAILWSLARHGDWADGWGAYPSQATIAADVGMSERQVQHYLRSLRCTPAEALARQCQDAKCRHRGLITLLAPATRYQPAMYALALSLDWAQQASLPEVGDPQTVAVPRTKRRCSVAGCSRVHTARGLCRRHYLIQYRKHSA